MSDSHMALIFNVHIFDKSLVMAGLEQLAGGKAKMTP